MKRLSNLNYFIHLSRPNHWYLGMPNPSCTSGFLLFMGATKGRFIHRKMKYRRENTAMKNATENENISKRLAWAVLAQTPSGRSEVIKITDHEDADSMVQHNPNLYFKSGPVILPG